MSFEWRSTTWGEVAKLEYGKSLRDYQHKLAEFPVFGTNGPIGWHTTPLCKTAGVIIGRKGAYRGIHYSNQPFFVIDTAFYLSPIADLDMRWAYYCLLTYDINGMDSGSAIPSTSRDEFYKLPITLPNLVVQRQVANFLSLFDDRITLLRETNATLEAIAQALFKSWFVDFDPVRAKMEGRAPEGMDKATAALFPDGLEESALGMVPKGWKVGTLKDCCLRVESGGTPKRASPEYWNGDIPWLTSGEVRNPIVFDTKEKITQQGVSDSSAKLWPKGTTIVAMYGATAGEVCLLAKPATANQACCGLIPLPNFRAFLYFRVRRERENLASKSSGSAQQNLNKGLVEGHQTLIPSKEIVAAYETIIGLLLDGWIDNEQQSQTLSTLRDTLLPRLISGQLRLPEADVSTEELIHD